MSEYLIDNNVISRILKGHQMVTEFVVQLNFSICTVVYIEALQGSISNAEKLKVKMFLDNFSLLHITDVVSERAIYLIEKYSNTHGLLLADSLIAATALENDLTLITYNIADFKFIQDLKHLRPSD